MTLRCVKFKLVRVYRPDAVNPDEPEAPPRNHVLTFGPGNAAPDAAQPTGIFDLSLPPDEADAYQLGAEYTFTPEMV